MATPTSLTYKIGGVLEINRMGYGGMQLTGPGVWGDAPERETAKRVLLYAVESGVNFIDTADSYGPHTNEVLIREALSSHYSDIVVATKGGLERTGPNQWPVNGRPEYIRQTIDGSLQRLGKDEIQLWQLHRVDPDVPIEETLGPVADAVKAGKIRHVGLSEAGIADIERAQTVVPIVSVQNRYNLSERSWEEIVDYTAERGIAFIPWYPLASGPAKMQEKIGTLAEKYEATPAQIALAWLLNRSPNILLIPGTKSLKHLQENLKAVELDLSGEDVESLTAY
ncbi:aldo/keto reductase [Parapedobacter sp. ISTM3]|uniref:Predicted oxidoreductase n=1 Tax=Parapedobacter luteus TaxID=623280 RepID=A0A1T5AP18_9SPHI|nr:MULTISPECIES: aldo/keto reductase [Parapedobacter]MBK1441901.1 aldo/keto reductase [Parapedobacter sp. ISTM3]SKB36363.1 Predicted oxidoreductase [Parapedobacter luteus]